MRALQQIISRAALAAILPLALLLGGSATAAPAKTSCIACHSNADSTSAESVAISKYFADDIHGKSGLSCHDCHGGNPDPNLAEDMVAAMDDAYKPNPFVGEPERKDIPTFCGRCHSSLTFMRKFDPRARVDQEAEYWTSKHGQLLKKGDTGVATCIDCHGVHGIRRAADQQSPVYPTKVGETCSKCHTNVKVMTGRLDDRGKPLPLDQFARWRRSVHAAAMFDKGDLTAPTCNDCHGNHGALPPGIESVANVCGQCHGREAELFRAGPKQAAFNTHNEFLATSDSGCSSCHDALPASVTSIDHFSECATCHENHGVVRPTVALLGVLPETPCAFCHEGVGDIAKGLPEPKKHVDRYIKLRDELLKGAETAHITGDARFDWLVDMAQKLPPHVVEGTSPTQLRPEFAHLFQKFRIGKTHYTYKDPLSGADVKVPVRKCIDCHRESDSSGLKIATAMTSSMREVTALTARSERVLLRAKRGGVEVRNAQTALEGAVDAQIELEVLVHSFATGGEFATKQKEAVAQAATALRAGRESLNELADRRKGLAASLGIIALVLIGLGLKIRDLS